MKIITKKLTDTTIYFSKYYKQNTYAYYLFDIIPIWHKTEKFEFDWVEYWKDVEEGIIEPIKNIVKKEVKNEFRSWSRNKI